MRLIRILVAAAIIVAVPVLTASAADATISGTCTASGTINGKTYDAAESSVVIPQTGDVHWKGAVDTGGSGKRLIEGKVFIKVPWPISKIEVGGSWDGPSSRYANAGVYHYDLPSVLIGPKITLFGHHSERGTQVCTGSIEVQIAGSKWKNPALIASLVLTVLAIVNMALVIRVKGMRV